MKCSYPILDISVLPFTISFLHFLWAYSVAIFQSFPLNNVAGIRFQIHFPVRRQFCKQHSSLLSEGLLLVSINRRKSGKEWMAREEEERLVHLCLFTFPTRSPYHALYPGSSRIKAYSLLGHARYQPHHAPSQHQADSAYS